MEWQKLYFISLSIAGYASRGKYISKKLLSGEEDTVSNGYGVLENTHMP